MSVEQGELAAAAATSLRVVLDAVERGEIVATERERDRLEGAEFALRALAEHPAKRDRCN